MNNSRIYFAICFISLLFLTGCQTAQPPATASGRPETTINAPVAEIKALIISRALNNGMSITKDTDYSIQFEKPTDNMAAAVLLGSRFNAIPSERYIATFAPLGNETRVVISSMIVTNPGTAFEQITPITAGDGINKTQQTLEEIKRIAESSIGSAPPSPADKPNTKRRASQ